MWMRCRRLAEYLLFRGLVATVDALPPRATVRAAETLAFVLHYCLPRRLTRYHVSRENLIQAFGDELTEADRSRIVYRMWVHLFRLVAEVIQSPRKMHLETYRELIEFGDLHECNEALLSGRPVILLGGHFGNWEVGMAIFGLWGIPMGVVARTLDNDRLNDWFRDYREATGHRMLAKKGDFDDMLTLIQRGGNLAMLCDQDAGPRGLFVDFFGRPASTFKSLALLAIEYDALMIVGSTTRLPDDFDNRRWFRFRMNCEAVVDPRDYTGADAVREITETYTRGLEQAIRRNPEQYFWVHRRWKSEPRSRRKAA